jgi:hypothetical protein
MAGGASPALPRKQPQDRARGSSSRAGSLGSTDARRSAWGCCVKASKGKGVPAPTPLRTAAMPKSANSQLLGCRLSVVSRGEQNNHVAVA